MEARFLAEEESDNTKRGKVKTNPVVGLAFGSTEKNSWFLRSSCTYTYIHTCRSYSSCLRGSESSETPAAKSTFNSHVLVSKCRSPLKGAKWLIPGKGQGKRKNSTEQLVVPERKEALKESRTMWNGH